MQVKQVNLTNFRNYSNCSVALPPGKTVLIGENAQGKSNFLEAIEVVSQGNSSRAAHDTDMINWNENHFLIDLAFERAGCPESLSYQLTRKMPAKPGTRASERRIKVNGVTHGQIKYLLGHLVTVSFQTQDLNLLRGGPKYRRDWIDGMIVRLRPAFADVLSSYQKVVTQRNRLLKNLAERGRVSVTDQDELLAWDKQLARFAAAIIKARVRLIAELLPRAADKQSHLSGAKEVLDAAYLFRASERAAGDDFESDCGSHTPLAHLLEADGGTLTTTILSLTRERRGEEIARKQTLVGPHRDDIIFRLNNSSAVDFASQGQQRSLVLSLKLAELARLQEAADESPVLLLDDVMAELDAGRQGLLMSAVANASQTLITTTHLSGFAPEWLEDATIYSVSTGTVNLLAAGGSRR